MCLNSSNRILWLFLNVLPCFVKAALDILTPWWTFIMWTKFVSIQWRFEIFFLNTNNKNVLLILQSNNLSLVIVINFIAAKNMRIFVRTILINVLRYENCYVGFWVSKLHRYQLITNFKVTISRCHKNREVHLSEVNSTP